MLSKKVFLILIIAFWVVFAVSIRGLVHFGYINQLPPIENDITGKIDNENFSDINFRLQIAQDFAYSKLSTDTGHINLYYLDPNTKYNISAPNQTNSEAVSYYMLWNAETRNKIEFDKELDFIQKYMLNKNYNYLMWRLEANDSAIGDGQNIASDADLRAIKALYIAKETWGDKKYSDMIDTLSSGLENVAVSKEMFVPYGGIRDGSVWRADVVWISYSDFDVFRKLAFDKGKPWVGVYDNMKKSVLDSQLDNGLFNPVMNQNQFSNTLDQGYSINSLWVMVRAAESGDKDLQNAAAKSLNFYKEKYSQTGRITSAYTRSGEEIGGETAWAYALVGRTAIALGDENFAHEMVIKTLENQETNSSSEFYGGFPEGNPEYVSQFTLHEAILTCQDYINKNAEQN